VVLEKKGTSRIIVGARSQRRQLRRVKKGNTLNGTKQTGIYYSGKYKHVYAGTCYLMLMDEDYLTIKNKVTSRKKGFFINKQIHLLRGARNQTRTTLLMEGQVILHTLNGVEGPSRVVGVTLIICRGWIKDAPPIPER